MSAHPTESERYLRELSRGLPLLRRRRIVSELRHHLEQGIAEEEARGLSHDEAERVAIERLGAPDALAARFAADAGARASSGSGRRRVRIGAIAGGCAVLAAAGLLAFSATRSSHPEAVPPTPGHGPSIVSVRALPAAVQQHGEASLLSVRRLNTVTVSTALGFKVVIRNRSGQPANVTVTLTIDRDRSSPIVTQRTLGAIPPSETRTLTFDHLGAVPFAAQTNLEVALPSGDAKVYPVIFSLPSGNGPFVPVPPGGRPIAVPAVVGLTEQAALARLQSLGLNVLVVSVPARRPQGTVVGQAAGSAATFNGRPIVRIVVSTGLASRR